MKIVLLSTSDRTGGASIAALRLHKGLRSLGQDSWMLVKDKSGQDPHVTQLDLTGSDIHKEEDIFRLIGQRVIAENRTAISNTGFSLPYPGYDVSHTNVVQAADVVNLHWIALFQSVESVAALLDSGKPVVWTLHDQNPFSGGCHFSAGCLGYRGDCRDCPQLRQNALQLPAKILEAKKKYWRRQVTIVAPSRWLADCARQSALFGKCRIEVIANSLDHEIYRPIDKVFAKKALGLKPERLYLLFSAFTKHEKRKGFSLLIRALQYCLRQDRFRGLAAAKGIAVLTLGPHETGLEGLGIPLHPLGMVADDHRIARIYAAADMLVLPSLEENLPNVMLEAMACGTPVVGFAIGGMPDVIENGVTGMMATPGSPEDLAEAVLRLAFDSHLRIQQGQYGRRLIESHYKLSDQSQNYLKLYEELLIAKPPSIAPHMERMPASEKRPPVGTAAIDRTFLFSCFRACLEGHFLEKHLGPSRWTTIFRKKWRLFLYILRNSGFKNATRLVIRKFFNFR